MIQTLFGSSEQKPGLFERMKEAVSRTRENLSERIEEAVGVSKEIDRNTLDDLEGTLLGADLGSATTHQVLEKLRERVDRKQIKDVEELKRLLKEQLLAILNAANLPPVERPEGVPEVVLVVGVNGTGKTTTIGKLAQTLRSEGKTVLLCAADTFRAAAIEQLEVWGQRTGTEVIRTKAGGDPAAVLYDALEAANARHIDCVVVDTAGRLHTKANLMAELEKMRRTGMLVEGGKLLPLSKQDLPFFTSFFTVMSGLIMLIACANVGNMMLARAAGRRKEIAVRLALGAGRARIVRQLLTESMIVVAGAAVPGFLASMWLMRSLSGVRMPLLIPVAYDFQPDARVLILTIVLTGLTGLAFGLVPALQATRDLAPALKEGGAVRLPGRHRLSLRNLLMIGQFAGSLTLLVILGMLSMGIQSTLGIQAGFNPRNLYLISLDPIRDGYSAGQTTAFVQKLLDRVKLLPSVTSASLTESVPVSIGAGRVRVSSPGNTHHETRTVIRHVVGKDYFDTTGIALPAGRAFRREDETGQTAAVIVSQEFARQFWPGSDPLGRQIEIGNDEIVPSKVLPGSYDYRVGASAGRRTFFEVVGVAGDVAEGLVAQKPSPAVYFPLQTADFAMPAAQGMTLMVRAAPGVDAVAAVRREMSAMDANITPFNIRSMPEQIDRFMGPLRMASWTYGLIGFFGLVLSSVGLAGMTAYSVARRGREIGIRMALGAQRANVLGLVMKEGMFLATVGTAIGLAGAWTGSRLLSALNSSVGRVTSTSTYDLTVLLGAPLLLSCLALLACYLPARRSMRIDPVVALRQE